MRGRENPNLGVYNVEKQIDTWWCMALGVPGSRFMFLHILAQPTLPRSALVTRCQKDSEHLDAGLHREQGWLEIHVCVEIGDKISNVFVYGWFF